jgi:hypothetical protein
LVVGFWAIKTPDKNKCTKRGAKLNFMLKFIILSLKDKNFLPSAQVFLGGASNN